MQTDVWLNGSPNPSANYVGWSPSPCRVTLTAADGLTVPVSVTLRNQRTDIGGQVLFRHPVTQVWQRQATFDLAPDGTPVDLAIAGDFGRASTEDRDAAIEVIPTAGGAPLSTTRLMVRIRKDATTLTVNERDRFLWALARLNNAGLGLFRDFRCIHTNDSRFEAHENAGFLPWHRTYLLDFERELQRSDPSVALPYWRFDRPAPNLLVEEFLGRTLPDRTVVFAPRNPLQFWSTDGTTGISRWTPYDLLTKQPPVLTEAETLAQGASGIFDDFRTIETTPHKTVHAVFFTTDLASLHTAVRDPLFFLLHANVDRLWAKWQRLFKRYDETDPRAYPPTANRIGHAPGDTMWPWNGVLTSPRPSVAPGGTLARSSVASAPGLMPRVGVMLDYQGALDPSRRLGFDYDDVPY